MDYATRMALRAIVSGLHHSGTIAERQIIGIMQALQEAAETAKDHGRPAERDELMDLSSDIGRDGRIGD